MAARQIRITRRQTIGLAAPRTDLGAHTRALLLLFTLLAGSLLGGCAETTAQKWPQQAAQPAAGAIVTSGTLQGEVPTVVAIDDPGESANRSYFGFNDGLAMWVMRPLTSGWRFIFPQFVRECILRFSTNLGWPDRFINNLLQGKYKHAGVETARFVVNSTIGILGLFDPATPMGMDAHPEDFGKTFADWGSGPPSYFDVPFVGPSNGRDFGGWILDTIFDISSYAGGVLWSINKTSFHIDDYLTLRKMEQDPYVYLRDYSALARQIDVLGYQITTTATTNYPTIKAVYFSPKDPDFYQQSDERTAQIPGSRRSVVYSLWLQPAPAPVVYFLPGTGVHRLSPSSIALAEMAWNKGYSAVVISNAFNWEFMEKSSTQPAPGYPPADAQDVYEALDAIHRDLDKRHPRHVTASAIAGLSLGGVHAMLIGKIADQQPPESLHFERVIAINPPVDLAYALDQIDQYYNTPLHWPAEQRADHERSTLLKAYLLTQGQLDPRKNLPFTDDESRYLIGLFFRLILRDTIYSSQSRYNVGVIRSPFDDGNRDPAYQEIMRLSFKDYLDKILLPLDQKPGGVADGMTRDQFIDAANMHSIEPYLRDNPRLQVFVNEDDFLLRRGDMVWLRFILGDRLTVNREGGHLGNLYLPEIQNKIMSLFGDMTRVLPPAEKIPRKK